MRTFKWDLIFFAMAKISNRIDGEEIWRNKNRDQKNSLHFLRSQILSGIARWLVFLPKTSIMALFARRSIWILIFGFDF